MKRDYFICADYENNGCDCKQFETYHMTFKDAVYTARSYARFYGSYCEYSFVTVTVYDDCENIVFEV